MSNLLSIMYQIIYMDTQHCNNMRRIANSIDWSMSTEYLFKNNNNVYNLLIFIYLSFQFFFFEIIPTHFSHIPTHSIV